MRAALNTFVCAVPARNTVRIHNVLEIQQTIAIRNF